jgi:hypothetical protein
VRPEFVAGAESLDIRRSMCDVQIQEEKRKSDTVNTPDSIEAANILISGRCTGKPSCSTTQLQLTPRLWKQHFAANPLRSDLLAISK